ncbi:uncharacterized protein [Apostichopus japonicus]|uniref:uncharacterized protein n=1 Tax=Stichopus japonicus TaxID=307972 RepID=UPI003AB40E7F
MHFTIPHTAEQTIKILNRRQAGEKTKWLNTPNTYSKVEVAQEYADWREKEEGEDEGYKTKIHWVGDKDPKSGDSLAITDPQQFARQGQGPKEYKKKAKTDAPLSDSHDGMEPGQQPTTRTLKSTPSLKELSRGSTKTRLYCTQPTLPIHSRRYQREISLITRKKLRINLVKINRGR